MTDEQRAFLATLTPEQRWAVKEAFIEWVMVGQREDYAPMQAWSNFRVEVDHSSLLRRLLEGKPPLSQKPSLRYAYPVYPDDDGA